MLGVGGPDPVDGLAAQVRVEAGVLGLGGQLGQVAATLAAVLTRQPGDDIKPLSLFYSSHLLGLVPGHGLLRLEVARRSVVMSRTPPDSDIDR